MWAMPMTDSKSCFGSYTQFLVLKTKSKCSWSRFYVDTHHAAARTSYDYPFFYVFRITVCITPQREWNGHRIAVLRVIRPQRVVS